MSGFSMDRFADKLAKECDLGPGQVAILKAIAKRLAGADPLEVRQFSRDLDDQAKVAQQGLDDPKVVNLARVLGTARVLELEGSPVVLDDGNSP